MFEAEACWLRHALDGFATERLSPALNLGSSQPSSEKQCNHGSTTKCFRRSAAAA
jgi:hypothetical protein